MTGNELTNYYFVTQNEYGNLELQNIVQETARWMLDSLGKLYLKKAIDRFLQFIIAMLFRECI
jgi:hypothetical protein